MRSKKARHRVEPDRKVELAEPAQSIGHHADRIVPPPAIRLRNISLGHMMATSDGLLIVCSGRLACPTLKLSSPTSNQIWTQRANVRDRLTRLTLRNVVQATDWHVQDHCDVVR
jgi:hypothetical protein